MIMSEFIKILEKEASLSDKMKECLEKLPHYKDVKNGR